MGDLAYKQAHLIGVSREYLVGGAAICEPAEPARGRRQDTRAKPQTSGAVRRLGVILSKFFRRSFVFL